MNQKADFVGMTTEIVCAYVFNGNVSTTELPELIKQIHDTLEGLGNKPAAAPAALIPAVSVRESVTPDFLICLEDGKPLKSLKRHLRTKYNMSPEDYRAKWVLPESYPMVAPNYSEHRSNIAKARGLGRSVRRTGAR